MGIGFYAVVIVMVVSFTTVAIFRYLTRRLGTDELLRSGAILAKDALELPGAFWLMKKRIAYDRIESVEVVPFHVAAFAAPFRYGFSIRNLWTRMTGRVVVITLKKATFVKYVLFTPKNAEDFVCQLRTHITEKAANSPY